MDGLTVRRGGRVAEGTGLLNRHTGLTRIVSSNLISSAISSDHGFSPVIRSFSNPQKIYSIRIQGFSHVLTEAHSFMSIYVSR